MTAPNPSMEGTPEATSHVKRCQMTQAIAITLNQEEKEEITMLEDPKVFLESLQSSLGRFSKVDGETLKAFGNLNETALKPGALDRKTKTLMCIAIAIATRCEYCISARTAQAIEAGATREELIETASVGLLMGGSLAVGPIVTLFVETINLLAPESGK